MAQYDKKELFETGKQKALDEKLLNYETKTTQTSKI